MIKLTRKPKPHILIENEEEWTASLEKAVSKYKSFNQIPKNEKKNLLKHYRHAAIKSMLFESSHKKCAFCETFPGQSGDIEVEHYAPKSLYPKLTFEWKNLLPACKKCNGYKGDHDTVEEPILNPYDIDPKEVFRYEDIKLVTNNDRYKSVGELTIDVCGLNAVRLMQPRADLLIVLHRYSDTIKEAIRDYNEADTQRKKDNKRKSIMKSLEAIENLADPSQFLSGYSKHYLKNCVAYQEAKKMFGV